MPELPEVETTKQGLLPLLKQTVTAVYVRQPRLRQLVPDSLNEIVGQTCLEFSRRGKYIILKTERGHALIHLGMSGSLRLCSPTEDYRKHDHVILNFSNGLSLRFHDPRRFGVFLWLTTPIQEHPLLASLGVEPLTDDFDGVLAMGRMIILNILLYFSPTPGGSGIAEGGFILLFNSMLPEGTVGIVAVTWRLIAEYIPFLIGFYYTIKVFGRDFLNKPLIK
jgi:hypothetical protein